MPFRLTTIATFRTPTAAWVARNYLAALGIRAFVIDEHIATAIWTWGNAIGWTKLQVEAEFELAAHQALLRWREARELLMAECRNEQPAAPEGGPLPPACMDRKPVTAAERPQPKMNQREDLVQRAKLSAVGALILMGNAVGLPGAWEYTTGHLLFGIGMLGLLGYSTWLLWSASQSQETLRPMCQNDLFWARCVNATVYSSLALVFIYCVAIGNNYY